MAKRPRTRRGLTKERWKTAIRVYSQCGIYARVAEQIGVDQETLKIWRDANPEFQADLDAAGAEYDSKIGSLARSALEMSIQRQLDGAKLPDRYAVSRTGERFLAEEGGLYEVDAAKLRTALTKLDPSWTHPKKEVDVTVKTPGELLDALDDGA